MACLYVTYRRVGGDLKSGFEREGGDLKASFAQFCGASVTRKVLRDKNKNTLRDSEGKILLSK